MNKDMLHDTSKADEFLRYCEEVLGLRQVLMAQPNEKSTLVLVSDLVSYNTPELQLLEKMLAAIGIPLADCELRDSNQIAHSSSAAVIFKFSDNPQNDETYSPRHLLKNPQDKKEAWAYLKAKQSQVALT
jgi:hypothetical protein